MTIIPQPVFAAGSLAATGAFLWLFFAKMAPSASAAQYRAVLEGGAYAHLLLGAVTLALLLFVETPMGKMKSPGKNGGKRSIVQRLIGGGFQANAREAWVLQECPTLLAVAVHAVLFGVGQTQLPRGWDWSNVPMLLFVAHYTHRALIYPFVTLRSDNTVPLGITVLANAYCCFNGRLQSGLFFLPREPSFHATSVPLAVVGLAVFIVGMTVNVTHDRMLSNLRKSGHAKGSGYVIPRGGLFEFISAPNLVGEIVEWFGYALVCSAAFGLVGAMVGGSFSLYVMANVGPRVFATHRWYLERFGEEYRRLGRAALIPKVL
jgi:3-oxo-5-alpha-steroid 4-dehydrogenase 1